MNFAALLFLLACATAGASSEVDKILGSIKEKGAKQTVADLNVDPSRWNSTVDHVASGERAWLKLAVALREGTDAATSEDLHWAVASALQKNPGEVLTMTEPKNTLPSHSTGCA
jgi:hypothetical protein